MLCKVSILQVQVARALLALACSVWDRGSVPPRDPFEDPGLPVMRLLCSARAVFPQKPHGPLPHAHVAPAASICFAWPSHVPTADFVTLCVTMRHGAVEQACLTTFTVTGD